MITVEHIDEIIEDVKTAYYEQIERDYKAWEQHRDERPEMSRLMPELLNGTFKDLRTVTIALDRLRHEVEISCKEE